MSRSLIAYLYPPSPHFQSNGAPAAQREKKKQSYFSFMQTELGWPVNLSPSVGGRPTLPARRGNVQDSHLEEPGGGDEEREAFAFLVAVSVSCIRIEIPMEQQRRTADSSTNRTF